MSFQDEIYMIADELRGIANEGARYADNDYDRQRYGRVLSLSARLVAAIEQRSPDEVMEEYKQNLARVTPFVAASAAVFRDGCILLIKREDNGLWAMPGGWTEVGETWAQSVERELREETCLGVRPRSCSACSTPDYGAAGPSITSTTAYGSSRFLKIRPLSPARKQQGRASSRSTTCPRNWRRDTSSGTDGIQARAWRPAGAVLRPDDLIPVTRLSSPAVVD